MHGRDSAITRGFWVRLSLTMLLVAFPLAWGLVVLRLHFVVVVVASTVAGVALLAIWDGVRSLPPGFLPWTKPEPLRDRKTGLYNPDGWAHQLVAEEDRCRRHGLSAGVLALHVTDQRGSDVGVRTARVLQRISRNHDVLAYLGEGSFALLAIGSGAVGCDTLARRVCDALEEKGLQVRVSTAARDERTSLAQAWAAAERAAGDTPQGRIAV